MHSKTKGTTLVSDLSDVLSLQPDVDPGSLVPLDGEAEGRVDVDELAHLPHCERRPGVRLDRLATHQLQLVEGGRARIPYRHLDHLGARDAARAACHVLCRYLQWVCSVTALQLACVGVNVDTYPIYRESRAVPGSRF